MLNVLYFLSQNLSNGKLTCLVIFLLSIDKCIIKEKLSTYYILKQIKSIFYINAVEYIHMLGISTLHANEFTTSTSEYLICKWRMTKFSIEQCTIIIEKQWKSYFYTEKKLTIELKKNKW